MDNHISIGRVKREISDLVNRVAYAGERIILTSRGKPKAALVSMDDYARLRQAQVDDRQIQIQTWLAHAKMLSAKILERRGRKMIDVDTLLQEDREDLEARDDWITSGD